MGRQQRMSLIKKIQNKRESVLVSYITSDRRGLETRISGDIFPMLHKHLSDINNHKKIDVFLYTPGGDIIAAFGFVNLFREFCNEFNVIIPFKALSSGTLIALGANELVMTKMGQLSPIDPSVSHPLGPQIQMPETPNAYQILPVNVEDINAFFSLATEEAGLQDEESRRKVFEILASNVNPITLGAVQRSRQQISFLASTLMGYHIKDEDQIEKIVRILTRERFSHSYIISRTEAKEELGLNIIDPDSDFEQLIVDLLDQYNQILKFDQPYNQEAVLGSEDRKVAQFDRGIIESVDLTHTFRTVKEVARVEVAPQQGVPPQMGYVERNLQEEWVEVEDI